MTDEPTVDEVRRYLTELPDLCALLPAAAITRASHGDSARHAPGPKPPCRLDVLDLLDARSKGWAFTTPPDPDRVGVLPYLDSWARDIEATALDERPELPDELPEQPTVANTCEWLLGELQWASTLPQWPEMALGIQQTWKAVRVATRGVRDVSERPVPCNRCGSGRLERVVGEKPLWECTACGHRVAVQAVTLRQAAKIVGVGKSTLYAWARRSLLVRVTDGSKVLYDLASVQRVVAEERLRAS